MHFPSRISILIFASLIIQLFWCAPAAFAQHDAPAVRPMPDFSKSAKIIRENRAVYRCYQDSVFARTDEQTWVDLMFRRAEVCQQMFPHNNTVLNEITDYFKQDPALIPDAAYDSLFNILDDLGSYSDVFLLEHYTNILLPHYEARNDTTHLLALNHYAGYCFTDFSRSYEPEMVHKAAEYFKRNIEYGRHYPSLDPTAADVIPRDYINFCYMLTSLGGVSPEEGLAYTDDFEDFLTKNSAYIPAEQLAFYQDYLSYIRTTSFRIFSTLNAQWSAADSVALKKMFDVSPFGSGTMENLETADDSLCYYHAMAMLGKMPVRAAYQECDKILMKIFARFNQLDKIEERDLLDIVNGMVATFKLMEASNESEYFMTQRVVNFTFQLIDMIQRIRIVGDYVFFDFILSSLASEKAVVNHLPSGMKEMFLGKIAVKSQVGTVVHVNMVEKLSVAFFEGLLDSHPEIFIGVMGCNTTEDLYANRSELMQYISMAALFHDLGKTQMSEIVGNNFRRLTDHEFNIIKMHPEKSLIYFELDSIFYKYKDVSLGHHKWYNGKGGYPASFNNVASPWRPMIDLVTLCDCIDAATDYLDRNYRVPKTLDQVVEEFRADAGTRYNPDMVKVLLEDKALRERLNSIIMADRPRQASMVRARYIHVKEEK